MLVLLLEALLALAILVLIVWWTMFAGRRGGELPAGEDTPARTPPPASPQPDETPANKNPGDRPD